MNGSPSVRVALFIRESGSESPCRWFYVTGIYTIVTYNGYRFRFTTFDDEILRTIQFYIIETDLEQAVGRARLLRCDATVKLFSNFPLRQAILMESEYDQKEYT